MSECQKSKWNGRCCCNCSSRLTDYHHCCTVPKPQLEQMRDQTGEFCVCSIPKGWICASPEIDRVHSGWTEHGICECHVLIKTIEVQDE